MTTRKPTKKPAAKRPRKPATPKPTIGRPSSYTEAIGLEICRLLVEGGKDGGPISLLAVTKLPGMPGYATVFNWIRSDPIFEANYRRAREDQADANADQVTHIADTVKDLPRAHIRIEARKWYAGQMKPKSYGAKTPTVAVNSGGGAINVTLLPEDKDTV